MKTKYLSLGIFLLLAAGVWFGRVAWRAHHQIVSLDVRNVPLAEVLRKIERQTWKKIRAENTLSDVRITLRVKDKPLKYVLNRLAEQSGARWSTLYAVYRSTTALKTLDSALRNDGKFEPAGWTKVAPKLPDFDAANAKKSIAASQPKMMIRRRGDSVMQTGPDGQVEAWSPEELVMESSLSKRLDGENSPTATARAAEEIARKVNGKWTMYLAFRKSRMGIGFTKMGIGSSGPGSEPGTAHRRMPNDRFDKLTPEQRVQRARERPGSNKK